VTGDGDFDGCHRECRVKGAHSRIWGGCEFGSKPEPTVSMSRIYLDTDGYNSIGYDTYTAEELADGIIEPVLRGLRVAVGSDYLSDLERGVPIRLFADEENGMRVARLIARAIIERNDPPELIPLPGIPVHGVDCSCPKK
jgi:hypothetical protein